MPNLEFDDDLLAAIYDDGNPASDDHDYFRSLADQEAATRIADLGCGTGLLTVTLAADGRQVVGIDPAAAMLRYAAARPGGDAVEWRLGTSEQIEEESYDLVIMSGNVSMHIIGEEWHETLLDIARGLRPGGLVAFETRNPLNRAWEGWGSPPRERTTEAGLLRASSVVDPIDQEGVVTMHSKNEFITAGHTVQTTQPLQFRTAEQIRSDLNSAGLHVTGLWRNWHRAPFTNSPEEPGIVVEARSAG